MYIASDSLLIRILHIPFSR